MKKKIICAVLTVVLLAGAAVGVDLLFLRGREYVIDGIRQNTCLYADCITVADGKLSYTLVNETFHEVTVNPTLNVERRVGEKWQAVVWRGPLLHVYRSQTLKARSNVESYTYLETFLGDTPVTGEYRFILGDLGYDNSHYMATGENVIYHIYDPNTTYIVGYFTVTEEML